MAVLDKQQQIIDFLTQNAEPLSLPDIQTGLNQTSHKPIPERSLRRLLVNLVEQGLVHRTGQKRGTKYTLKPGYKIASPDGEYRVPHLKFLDDVPKHRRSLLLSHIRDLWTHNSTALEGNSLSLGDTHFLLEEGLTVAGKPIREHQEIIGHARAIELIYSQLHKPTSKLISKELLFKLHSAVQTDVVTDIYKPIGAWKIENNGTYARDAEGKQIFIEFSDPVAVDRLMTELINYINSINTDTIKLVNAPAYYAKIHNGITQIHPFWDGNGRIARLVANLLLLKAGLPPLVIDQSKRKEYIEILNQYSLTVGQLTANSGVWPQEQALTGFIGFCVTCYAQTKALIETAKVY